MKPNKKFKEIAASVLVTLGLKEFDKDANGKPYLTDEQFATLKTKFGDVFASSFSQQLSSKNGMEQAETVDAQDYRQKLEALQKEFSTYKDAAEEKERNLNATIQKLSNSPEEDLKIEVPENLSSGKSVFKLNMNLLHNKVLDNYVNGDGIMAQYEDTVDTKELREEFGQYVHDMRYEIIHQLFGPLSCTNYMTTKMTDKTEYRAVQDVISSIVQSFTPYWTPKGSVKFTPLTIKNRKHKINVGIKPAEIMTDVLGYLYDEGLQPKDMPIVKYIINELLRPKAEEDREVLLATGEYEEFRPTGGLKDGIEGQEFGKSMDGFCTILKKEYENADTKVNFLLKGVELTPDNIVEKLENAVDALLPQFKKQNLTMHIDPDLVTMYNRAYQKKFQGAANLDSERQRIDFSKITFGKIDGMIGTKMFFITPKKNFIHLLSKNKGATKIWMEGENYDVKIFAEWWESTGFAIAEAIFAYVPPKRVAENSSEGGSDNSQTV